MDVDLHFGVGEALYDALHGAAHLGGIGDADGVRQIDGVHIAAADALHEAQHLVQVGNTLEGTAEGGGHADAQLQLGEALADAAQLLEGLVVGAVDVGLVVGLADGDHVCQILQAGSLGQLSALEVGDQRHQLLVGVLLHAVAGHLTGVHHLRNGPRADERGDLHAPDTAGEQPVDVFELLLRGQYLLEVLPAVTRPALKNFDLLHFLYASCTLLKCG